MHYKPGEVSGAHVQEAFKNGLDQAGQECLE